MFAVVSKSENLLKFTQKTNEVLTSTKKFHLMEIDRCQRTQRLLLNRSCSVLFLENDEILIQIDLRKFLWQRSCFLISPLSSVRITTLESSTYRNEEWLRIFKVFAPAENSLPSCLVLQEKNDLTMWKQRSSTFHFAIQ